MRAAMTSKRSRIRALALAFALAAAAGVVVAENAARAAVAPAAPPLASLAGLRDFDGKPFVASAPKRLELVVFWATWCDECRSHLGRELTDLNRRPDVAVITVNTDRDESRVREFLDKEKVELPVLRDPERALRRELRVFSVPHWALYKRTAAGTLELVRSQPSFDMDEIRRLIAGGGA